MHVKVSTKSVSTIGVLIAMNIILSRFLSIHTWNLKIGFSFVPVVVAAILYGPLMAALVAAIGDIAGAVLFPVGAYFPGFTVTALLTGAVFGLFLKKTTTVLPVILSVLTVQIAGSLLLNTLWVSILYGSPYGAVFMTRIYQAAAMAVVQIVSIVAIRKHLIPILKNSIIDY